MREMVKTNHLKRSAPDEEAEQVAEIRKEKAALKDQDFLVLTTLQ